MWDRVLINSITQVVQLLRFLFFRLWVLRPDSRRLRSTGRTELFYVRIDPSLDSPGSLCFIEANPVRPSCCYQTLLRLNLGSRSTC